MKNDAQIFSDWKQMTAHFSVSNDAIERDAMAYYIINSRKEFQKMCKMFHLDHLLSFDCWKQTEEDTDSESEKEFPLEAKLLFYDGMCCAI